MKGLNRERPSWSRPGSIRVVGGLVVVPRHQRLEGHAPQHSQQAFLPNRQITGDRAMVEWIVQAPVGTQVALSASADRAGTVHAEVTLD